MIKIIKKNLIYILPIIFVIAIVILIYHYKLYLYLIFIFFLIAFVVYSYFALRILYKQGYIGDVCRPVMIVYITISSAVIATSIVLIIISGGINA